jgi:hypothetical protein
MSSRKKAAAWGAMIVAFVGAIAVAHRIHHRIRVLSISGAVMRQDSDPRKQIPLAGVVINVEGDLAPGDWTTDANGFFHVILHYGINPGEPITLHFRHPEYQPLDLEEFAGDRIYLARMTPVAVDKSPAASRAQVAVGNIEVRYSVTTQATESVGSLVKTFQIMNKGGVPCRNQSPCSPDRRWKAEPGELALDAGEGNEFQNARASCIAGPCPFTTINRPAYLAEGRMLKIDALDWSDTATFLVEAEVYRVMVSSTSRESFPITFGEALNFAVPEGAEGVTVEAEMDGKPIVFPLGPNLILSWADCTASMTSNKARAFRCALKPGYRFQ